MKGRIHSLQSMGAVDGPGLRGVVFMQGCPLRCAYCHNPDTWDFSAGEEVEAHDLSRKILRFRSYYTGGGVTISGGEPLGQGKFVGELLSLLKAEGLHTALDTSGVGSDEAIEAALEHTDLVMCDVKFPTNDAYVGYTGAKLPDVLSFLEKVQAKDIPLWIRHVVVPGLTDTRNSILQIAGIAGKFKNLRRVELLPFQKLCLTKYQNMGIAFPLENVPACSPETLAACEEILIAEGIPCGH